MEPLPPIRSPQNARLKLVRAIRRGREREIVLFEGQKVVADALEAGAAIDVILFDDEQEHRFESLLKRARGRVECLPAEGRLLAEEGDLSSPPGILALAARPKASWAELARRCAEEKGVLLVAAGVQEPGNVGAMVRVAAGLGATGAVFLKGGASPWHPRALRGASGTTFRLPVVEALSLEELLRACQQSGIELWATAAEGQDHREVQDRRAVALLLGEEGQGLPQEAIKASARCLGIALSRGVESLNVATAAAVLLASVQPLPTGESTS